MSNTFHPGLTCHMAEQLATTIFDTNIELMDTVSLAERTLNAHACRAAGIMGNDPSSIYRSVWYRSDGWGHGGSAITWQERAEELEAELVTKNALIDRAKPLLEEYHSELDCSGETESRTANQIRKLLTDIEHN
jgi:hypothetical protein